MSQINFYATDKSGNNLCKISLSMFLRVYS